MQSLKIVKRTGDVVEFDRGRIRGAVQAAVRALEDDPAFNAGVGAVLTRDGQVELDAAIAHIPELAGRRAGVIVGGPDEVAAAYSRLLSLIHISEPTRPY